AIDGGKRNAAIDLVGALVDLLHVGMVLCARQGARADAALSGDAQALRGAQQLDAALVGTCRFCHAGVVAPLSLGAWRYRKAVAVRPPLTSASARRRQLETERQNDGVGLLAAGALVITVARPGLLEPKALIEGDRRRIVGGDLEEKTLH